MHKSLVEMGEEWDLTIFDHQNLGLNWGFTKNWDNRNDQQLIFSSGLQVTHFWNPLDRWPCTMYIHMPCNLTRFINEPSTSWKKLDCAWPSGGIYRHKFYQVLPINFLAEEWWYMDMTWIWWYQEPMVHRLVEVPGWGDWSAFPPLTLQVSCSSSLGQVLACLMVTPISEP